MRWSVSLCHSSHLSFASDSSISAILDTYLRELDEQARTRPWTDDGHRIQDVESCLSLRW